MANFLKTYDPKAVQLSISGYEVVGFAEGDMITFTRNEDLFTPVVGSKGDVSRAVNRNDTGTLTFRLQHTSPSVAVVDGYIAAEDNLGVPKLFNMVIEDPASGEKVVGYVGWPITQPERTWGNEVGVREYTFFVVQSVFATTSTPIETPIIS